MMKKIILTIILILMLGIITTAQGQLTQVKPSNSKNPTLAGFYQVSDGDVDICSKWGGTKKPTNRVIAQGIEFVNVDAVMSLMAEKTALHLPNGTIVLYKINYFLESPVATKLVFTAMKKGTTEGLIILEIDVPAGAPISQFFTKYIDEEYDILVMEYSGQRYEVPIIEVY